MQLKRRSMLKMMGLTGAALMTNRTHGAYKSSAHGTWWRGNLHMHTYWSDGRCFPEIAVDIYKNQLGYDFLALSDHNVFADQHDVWRKVVEVSKGWPPAVSKDQLDIYLKSAYGKQAQTRTDVNGETEVRLRPFFETKKLFDEPGRFLLMPGCEITQDLTEHDHINVHVNYVNLPDVIPSVKGGPLVKRVNDATPAELIAQNVMEVEALQRKLKLPTMLMLNHPQWRYLDVQPFDLITNPDVRFFEVCNGGSAFKPLDENPVDSNDYFWDTVNAFRAIKGLPLIYGTGSDDTHNYYDVDNVKKGRVGIDYIVVRSDSLTSAALLGAMHHGDFFASTGASFDNIEFSRAKRTLEVKVLPTEGVGYKIHFITTKKNFSHSTSVVEVPAVRGHGKRQVTVYSKEIGKIVKSVEGLSASYTMAADDLYVRAKIESSRPSAYDGHFHPKVEVAWSQPFA